MERLVMIVDGERGQSRLLSLGSDGIVERSLDGVDALAGEVLASEPDLILVDPAALHVSGANLVRELNRAGQYRSAYSWQPAQGELAVS